MKGRLAIGTVIMLVVAVLVIAVALYFLVYVTNFDSLFLSNDQRILKQYTTCVLAYCTDGYIGENPSKQVNQVGCLKSSGGRCELTCAQVKEKYYDELEKSGVTPEKVGDEKHYCRKEFKLSFEFSGVSLGGVVPLSSGQMWKMANSPEWICRPLKIPFTDIDADVILGNIQGFNTAEFQYTLFLSSFIKSGDRNCLMAARLSEASSIVFGQRIEGGACFSGVTYDSRAGLEELFTPIIAYTESTADPEEGQGERRWGTPIKYEGTDLQKTHSSGIYVAAEKFLSPIEGFAQPECEYEIQPNTRTQGEIEEAIKIIIEEKSKDPAEGEKERLYEVSGTHKFEKDKFIPFKKLHKSEQYRLARLELDSTGFFTGGVQGIPGKVSKCNFKTTHKGNKITYYVWSDPIERVDVYQNFGSCKTVTLDRDLEGTPLTPEDLAEAAETLRFSEPQVVVTGFGNDVAPYATAGGRVFNQRSADNPFAAGSKSEIHEGASTSYTNLLKDPSSSQPSAVSFNGKTYLAYVEGTGAGNKIIVRDVEDPTTEIYSLTDDSGREIGGPSTVAFGGKLYVFNHVKTGANSYGIMFYQGEPKTEGGVQKISWQGPFDVPNVDEASNKVNSESSFSVFPHAIVTTEDGKQMMMVAYAFSNQANTFYIIPDHASYGIRVVKFDGSKTWDLARVTDEDSDDGLRQGFPKMIDLGGKVYVFWDEYSSETEFREDPPILQSKISYKRYLGTGVDWEEFPHDLDLKDRTKIIQPMPVPVQGNLVVYFASYDGVKKDESGKDVDNKWDILSISANQFTEPETAPTTETPAEPQTTPSLPEPTPDSKLDVELTDVIWDQERDETNKYGERFIFKVRNNGELDVSAAALSISIQVKTQNGKPIAPDNVYSASHFYPALEHLPDFTHAVIGPGKEVSDYVGNLNKLLPPGELEVILTLDSHDVVKEFNEENNVKILKLKTTESLECLPLVEPKGSPSDKLDVVFLPEAYKDVETFKRNAKTLMDELLETDPWKSNKGKINFYYVRATDLGLVDKIEDKDGDYDNYNQILTYRYTSQCPGDDQHVILMNEVGTESGVGGFSALHSSIAVVKTHDLSPGVTAHELGHSFGGLLDEYVSTKRLKIVDPKDPFYTTPGLNANCDFEGCGKWGCSGTPKTYREFAEKCSVVKTPFACREFDVPEEDFRCVWIEDPKNGGPICTADPFGTNKNSDFGLSCPANIGCFPGCNSAANLWRPSYTSIMNNIPGKGENYYNKPSLEHINELLVEHFK